VCDELTMSLKASTSSDGDVSLPSPVHVLLISSLTEATGNRITAERIAEHLCSGPTSTTCSPCCSTTTTAGVSERASCSAPRSCALSIKPSSPAPSCVRSSGFPTSDTPPFSVCSTTSLTQNQKVMVELRDVSDFFDSSALSAYLSERQIRAVIGVHAYRAGCLLLKTDVPFSIVLGGTDVNVQLFDEHKRAVMEEALQKSVQIIAFHKGLLSDLQSGCSPDIRKLLSSKSVCITPAVQVLDSSLRDASAQRQLLASLLPVECQHSHIFLLAGGLRKVKAPHFAVDAFEAWAHACRSGGSHSFSPVLVIVGPVLDPQYSEQLFEQVASKQFVKVLAPIDQKSLHVLMSASTGLLNTSESEGLSNVLLEAMELGVPIIAR